MTAVIPILPNPQEVEKLLGWFQGNQAAADMIYSIGELTQAADDVADGDGTDIALVLTETMFKLETNSWFNKHRGIYQPLLLSSVLMWEATNTWAYSPRRELRIFAFVWREAMEQLISVTAYLIGGHKHAVRVAIECGEYYRDGETFEQWEKEHEHRRSADDC